MSLARLPIQQESISVKHILGSLKSQGLSWCGSAFAITALSRWRQGDRQFKVSLDFIKSNLDYIKTLSQIGIGGGVAQWVRKFVIKHDDLSLISENPHGGRRKLTIESCSLL